MARAGRVITPRPALRGDGGANCRPNRSDTTFDRRAIKWIRFRTRIVLLGMLLAFLGLGWRAVDLQVIQQDRFSQLAEQQALRETVLSPRRGRINDRHGEALALSVDVDSVFVEPSRIVDIDAVARQLGSLLEIDSDSLRSRMERGRHFAWVKRRVTPAEAKAVRDLEMVGVHINREARRFYPHRELASHVLGFAGIDGKGLEGLEHKLDGVLLGDSHSARTLRDARGNRLLPIGAIEPERLGGGSVELTLDRTIQYHAENALVEAIEEYSAKAGSVVVLDPVTGEIMALASWPTYNPNEPGSSSRLSRRNRAVTDTYEPGSVFKVFSIAAVLEAGLASSDDLVDCEKGSSRIGRRTIRDTQPHGEISVEEILKVSSNIGAAHLAARMGKEGLVEALKGFGFGERTGVEMPGEQRGILRSASDLSDICLATVSFGQGISATPLQMASALGAIANGGKLLKPWIVRKVLDERGNIIKEGGSNQVSRPISESTARTMTHMMEAVVQDGGTGGRAAVSGYRVAGKTGTSQKVDQVIGGYSPHKRIASFGGFIPAEDPKLVILVVIDEPQDSVYGGVVAAPVFQKIAEESVRYLGITPSLPLIESDAVAEAALPVFAQTGIVLPASLVPPPEGKTLVPNLLGMDLRNALRVLSERHLNSRPVGVGLVRAQTPAAGAIISPGDQVELELHPRG